MHRPARLTPHPSHLTAPPSTFTPQPSRLGALAAAATPGSTSERPDFSFATVVGEGSSTDLTLSPPANAPTNSAHRATQLQAHEWFGVQGSGLRVQE